MNETRGSILVVDDDSFTASLTGMVLEEAGYDVLLADGGVEALEHLAANPAIRLVVSDLNMPSMNGAQLFAELRKRGHPQRFVLLTGEAAEPIKAANPGVDAVVTKDEQLQDDLPNIIATLLLPRI
jgi:CheY-like chemotaxis protein